MNNNNQFSVLQGLVVLMVLLLAYVGFNFQSIVVSGIGFMLPHAWLFIACLLVGGVLTVKTFFKVEIQQTENEQQLPQKQMKVVRDEKNEQDSVEQVFTLKQIEVLKELLKNTHHNES